VNEDCLELTTYFDERNRLGGLLADCRTGTGATFTTEFGLNA
jgi:hypothetical protein